jgi:hypothetical protein
VQLSPEFLLAAVALTGNPSPATPPPNCDLPQGKRTSTTVLVYLAKERHRFPERRGHYVARPRRLQASQARAPLGAALRLLLNGETPRERRAGCRGLRGLRGLVDDVSIVEGQAIIDFRPALLSEAGWTTTSGGSFFVIQLELTVFQFPTVDSIRFELGGSCTRFYEAMQVGSICPVRERADAVQAVARD